VTAAHPLAAILDEAACGRRFPPADGAVDVLPVDSDGTRAVVAFTGHAYVLADVAEDGLVRRMPVAKEGGFGGALHPDVLSWLAGPDREIGSIDVVLVARGLGSAVAPETRLDDVLVEHSRVQRAMRHRRDVEVVVEPDGVVVLGRGLAGRRELSVELFDPAAPSSGAGRRLIAAGLAAVPVGEWCWAQVAPGNARSLRAFLACGFTPIASEVLLTAFPGHAGRV
jgi:hypothetical protein